MLHRFMRIFRSGNSVEKALKTDLHSHLIPGIDDGAKTMDESLQLVRALHALGYRRLITTPHTMMHRFPNSSETIRRGLDALREAIAEAAIDVTVEAASEYFLDEHFLAQIREKSLLTFGEREVLFEMSYVIPPVELDTVIFELQSSGYTPVLAHPERYLYLHKDTDRLARLKERGVRLQVNINSLGGYYSKPVQKMARYINEQGWIDYLGSDAHHRRHTDALAQTLKNGVIEKIAAKNNLRNNLL